MMGSPSLAARLAALTVLGLAASAAAGAGSTSEGYGPPADAPNIDCWGT